MLQRQLQQILHVGIAPERGRGSTPFDGAPKTNHLPQMRFFYLEHIRNMGALEVNNG